MMFDSNDKEQSNRERLESFDCYWMPNWFLPWDIAYSINIMIGARCISRVRQSCEHRRLQLRCIFYIWQIRSSIGTCDSYLPIMHVDHPGSELWLMTSQVNFWCEHLQQLNWDNIKILNIKVGLRHLPRHPHIHSLQVFTIFAQRLVFAVYFNCSIHFS